MIPRLATDLISADRRKAEHEEASQNEYFKAMDAETFTSLFSRLPLAQNLLQVDRSIKFCARVQPSNPVEIALLESKKVFYDQSQCSCYQGGDRAPVACKEVG